ncbi:hypothetical protein L2E82_50546 [Cichorium intybus]|nr:hypothetical protein L2E82_50546 [Cichorium intybus]
MKPNLMLEYANVTVPLLWYRFKLDYDFHLHLLQNHIFIPFFLSLCDLLNRGLKLAKLGLLYSCQQVRSICRDYGVVCIRREGQDIEKIISCNDILTEYKVFTYILLIKVATKIEDDMTEDVFQMPVKRAC